MIISGRYLTIGKALTSGEKKRLAALGLQRLFPGIYANNRFEWRQLKRWEQHRFLAHAVLVTNPRTILAGHSAAIALGLPVEGCPPRIHVRTRGSNRTTSLARFVHSSEYIMSSAQTHTTVNNVQFSTTSYEDIVIDSAVLHGAESALVIADYLLHTGKISKASLSRAIKSRGSFKGIDKARLVAQYATGMSESPRESVLRLLLAQAGFGDFLIQPTIFDRTGRFLGRVDYLFPQYGCALEYDGEGKYHGEFQRSREEALREDVIRHHEFTNAGITLLRINKDLIRTGKWLAIVSDAVNRAHPEDALDARQIKGGAKVPAIRQKYQRRNAA